MKLLTKVVKGVAYGDVSNQSVRNILTELSKSIKGNFTEQEMYDTLEYFDWKCPYTGRDLRKSLEDGDGTYATDHIYPQNREWCGLNVKGNLVIVDRYANSKKRDKDIDTFLLNDTEAIKEKIGDPVREIRLQKIKDFQKECDYDPNKIRSIVSPMLNARYDEVRKEQEEFIEKALEALNDGSVAVPTRTPVPSVTATATASKKKSKKAVELVFNPSDEATFKAQFIKSKQAHFVLTYDTGITKVSSWKAREFDESSNLRGNIESKLFWRNATKEGLIKVEAFVD